MEFAWNVQKKKITDIKGLEKEQNREGYIRNHNIDLSKTSLNYDLVESNFNLYQRIKNRIEDVRSVSRIQKNSIVDCSNIITVSELQFNKWGLEKTKDYFNEKNDLLWSSIWLLSVFKTVDCIYAIFYYYLCKCSEFNDIRKGCGC